MSDLSRMDVFMCAFAAIMTAEIVMRLLDATVRKALHKKFNETV